MKDRCEFSPTCLRRIAYSITWTDGKTNGACPEHTARAREKSPMREQVAAVVSIATKPSEPTATDGRHESGGEG